MQPRLILLLVMAGSVFFGCVYVWGRIIERLLSRQPIIPFAARSPVPWRGVDLLLACAVLIVAYAIPSAVHAVSHSREAVSQEAESVDEGADSVPEEGAAQETEVAADADADGAADDLLPELASGVDPAPPSFLLTPWLAIMQLLSALLALVLIVLGLRHATGAQWSDFGLWSPSIWKDVALGLSGMLAASVIVYMIQAVMVQMLGESEHPLLEMLKDKPNLTNLMLAAALAMLVAPIVEEFVFRGLLQGWLEVKQYEWAERYPLSIGRLPDGSLAIVCSATVFAALHATAGPDPIALFPLALVLGYIYYRTHRLLPCIVMHFCFNGFSVVALWLTVTSEMPT